MEASRDDRFGNMSKNRTMYPSEKILYIIGDSGHARFLILYRQVSLLKSPLMRRENIFRQRTAFEDLFLRGERIKLMSKLHKILSTNIEYLERAKLQWEKDLLVSWTDQEWENLKKSNISCTYNTAIREHRFKMLNAKCSWMESVSDVKQTTWSICIFGGTVKN